MAKKTTKQKKAKKEEFVPTPGPFVALGIPYRKDIGEFAADVQETLNLAYGKGLHVEMSPHPQGILVVCRDRQMMQQQHPLQGMLQQLFGVDEVPHLSAATCNVMNSLVEGIDLSKPETFPEALQKKISDGFFRRLSTEFLRQMEKELEMDMTEHDKRCNATDCNTPKFTAAVLEQLKKHLSLNVS